MNVTLVDPPSGYLINSSYALQGYFHGEHWARFPQLPYIVYVVVAVVSIVLGIIAFLGNAAVIWLYLKHKSLQTPANTFVLNLAITDFLMCIFNFPMLIVSSFFKYWIWGKAGCVIYGFAGGLTGFVSINTLTAMAIDRYTVIYKNQSLARGGSRRFCNYSLVVIWCYSIAWALLPVMGWGKYILSGSQVSCCFDFLTVTEQNRAYVLSIFVLCFGIQLLVIIYCYVSMFIAVFLHEREVNRTPLFEESEMMLQQRRGRKTEMRVAKLVLIIIFAFCISWTPFAAVALVGNFGNKALLNPAMALFPGILAKVSTVMNPVIYAISHPRFRKRLLICIKCVPKSKLRSNRIMLSSLYHASFQRSSQDGRGNKTSDKAIQV